MSRACFFGCPSMRRWNIITDIGVHHAMHCKNLSLALSICLVKQVNSAMEMQITFNYVCPSVYSSMPVFSELCASFCSAAKLISEKNLSTTRAERTNLTSGSRIRCSYWFVPVGDEMKFYSQVCLFHGFTRMGT